MSEQMVDHPVFFYDLGSPYAYLAAERVNGLFVEATGLPPVWQPILLGGLFRRFDRDSWANGPAREDGIAEVERRASAYGLPPIRWPDPWPGHYLGAMRACLVAAEAGALEAFARTALRMGFEDGRDLSQLEEVLAAGSRVGLPPEHVRARMLAREIKQRLIEETQAAYDRGVIGVPTLAAGDRLLWGDDQIP